MYRPFLITAVLSILCTLSVFIGRVYFPEFTEDGLFTLIGFFYLFCVLIIIGLSLRDFRLIYTKKTILLNLMLILVSTPATLVSTILIKIQFNVDLSEQTIIPSYGHTIRKNIYKYRSGQIERIEYRKFDNEEWTNHYNEFYKDSTWVYFNRFGDTTKIETYRNGSLMQTINK